MTWIASDQRACHGISSRRQALRRIALAVLTVAAAALRSAEAQHVVVENGDFASNITSGTIDSLTVSGTGPTGVPSTYAVYAPLTVQSSFVVFDLGVLDINADVTVPDGFFYAGTVFDGGVLNLNAGRLSSPGTLGVYGAGGSITRTAGSYSLGSLSLVGGVSLDYTPADSLGSYVSVADGSRFTLGRDLDLSSSSSFGSLNVSGTDAFVRNGHAYATDGLSLSGTAILTYTGSDSISEAVDLYDGGSLILEKDLSISGLLGLSGSQALLTNGHHWSAGSLALTGGAALSYGSGDSVTADVFIYDGGLTLQKDLVLTGGLQLNDTSAALVRGGHSFAARSLVVTNGAGLTFTGDDDVTTSVNVSDGGQLTLERNLFLSSTDSFTSISVTGAASALATGTFHYAADALTLRSAPPLTYRPGDSVTTNVTVEDGSALTLERDLSLAGSLLLSGSGALVTGTHAYAAASLELLDGASLDYRPGDAVTGSVVVSYGSTLTLGRNLSLTDFLHLSGTGALVTGAHSYGAHELWLSSGASLKYRPGDSVTGTVQVDDGSSLTLEQDLTLSSDLLLRGPGALTRTSQTVTASGLHVQAGAEFTYAAGDSITTEVSVTDGASLTLLQPLTLSNYLYLSGTDSFVTNGNTFSVGSLYLDNGATAGFGSGDLIGSYLSLSGAGSGLVATRPLTLNFLFIGDGSLLTVADSFSGTGGPGDWALSLQGNQVSSLDDYLARNLILSTGVTGTLTAVYDAGTDTTYLISVVPEPSTWASLLAGLAYGGLSVWRRRAR